MLRLSPFRLLCGAGMFAIFSSTMSKSPALPLFAAYLGASEANIGFIAAASTAVGIVVSLPAGALSDLWGRRRVILLAMAVFASAPFLYLLVNGVWGFVSVRIYHGLATAIFGPVALALVADLFCAERGEKMGWYSSATLIGRSVAPFVGGAILGAFALSAVFGYRAVYLVCGIGGVLALLPFAGSFWTLLPISLAFGLSMATVTASTAALVSDLAKAGSYGAALGTMSTIMDIGHASGPVVAGLLIGAYGYRVGLPAIGLALALLSLLFPIVVRSPEPARVGA